MSETAFERHNHIPDSWELMILGATQRHLSVTDLATLKCISCFANQNVIKSQPVYIQLLHNPLLSSFYATVSAFFSLST